MTDTFGPTHSLRLLHIPTAVQPEGEGKETGGEEETETGEERKEEKVRCISHQPSLE